MAPPKLAEADFVHLFEKLGPQKLAEHINQPVRKIYARRVNLEKKLGRQLTAPGEGNHRTRFNVQHDARAHMDVENGIVLVGSDAHYWPGPKSTAHRAFVKFAKEFKPHAVIMNGDAIDASTISRHPPIGWESRPTLVQEIEVCQERLHEIELAAGRAHKIWNLGNHDGRFETRLATVAPEYAKLHGVHLRDHFPLWQPAWSTWVNDGVVIKHRFKGGIHATHNNTMWAGKTIITGHLHSAKVTPFDDYNGRRYGVDTGCLADPNAKAFLDYTEDNPKNWRSGFCVLTFKKGRLMQPELVLVWDDDNVEFRGEVIAV